MTHTIRANKRDGDVLVLAMRFHNPHTNLTLVRLVLEPLAQAETLALTRIGMREENHATVGYTQPRALGFPAHLILTDPDNAHHALNLVADLRWARRQAKTKPTAVKTRIDELSSRLEASVPHFLPTFFEEISRIFTTAGNAHLAKHYFGRARETERAHGLAIAPERHAQAFAEFAAFGAISAHTFTEEAHRLAAHMHPEEAYRYFFNLLLNQAQTGVGLSLVNLTDLEHLGVASGLSAAEVDAEFFAEYVTTRSYRKSSARLLTKVLAAMPTVAKNHEAAHAFTYTIPTRMTAKQYFAALNVSGLWEVIRTRAETFQQWLHTLIDQEQYSGFFSHSDGDFIAQISHCARQATGMVITNYPLSCHPDYLDVFLEIGITITVTRREETLNFYNWKASHHRDLKYVAKDPTLRPIAVDTFFRVYSYLSFDPSFFNPFFALDPTRDLLREWLDKVREKKQQAIGCHRLWNELDGSVFVGVRLAGGVTLSRKHNWLMIR
ncbi:MAG: hypothetical protein Q4D85_08710 [Corynebacterium sp.]|uniref:hypothetical protein n=1 Tax=Corynebacterium sp. TaxID=1720 RepID=UPI0026DDBE0F|nr:hypothetical protein [Corynebacterium sp.]MDO5098827.1 hypothetical protein [Corynebacterium sp.]